MSVTAVSMFERILKREPRKVSDRWRSVEPFIVDHRLVNGIMELTKSDPDTTRHLIQTKVNLPFPQTVFIIDWPDGPVAYFMEEQEYGFSLRIYQMFPDRGAVFGYSFTVHIGTKKRPPNNMTAREYIDLYKQLRFRTTDKHIAEDPDFTFVHELLAAKQKRVLAAIAMFGGAALRLLADGNWKDLYPTVGITIDYGGIESPSINIDTGALGKRTVFDEKTGKYILKPDDEPLNLIRPSAVAAIKESAGSLRRIFGVLALLFHSDHVDVKSLPRPKHTLLIDRKPAAWLRKKTLTLKIPHKIKEALDDATRPASGTRGPLPWHSVRSHWVRSGKSDPTTHPGKEHAWKDFDDDDKRQWCSCGERRTLRSYPNGHGNRGIGVIKKQFQVTP